MSQSSETINFSFKEVEPDLSSFDKRFKHFFGVTNPVNFFADDKEVIEGVETVKKFKDLAS